MTPQQLCSLPSGLGELVYAVGEIQSHTLATLKRLCIIIFLFVFIFTLVVPLHHSALYCISTFPRVSSEANVLYALCSLDLCTCNIYTAVAAYSC